MKSGGAEPCPSVIRLTGERAIVQLFTRCLAGANEKASCPFRWIMVLHTSGRLQLRGATASVHSLPMAGALWGTRRVFHSCPV